jgi:hypothetical protein
MRQLLGAVSVLAALGTANAQEQIDRNKEQARKFYQDLWFTQNTDAYADYVAKTYIVHDTGDRKNQTEEAIEQKKIADFFWSLGAMEGEIDYQVAEDDMVVNRWTLSFEPNQRGRQMGMYAFEDVPIINVFRFNDEGKIVEIWNHRHDVDLPQPPEPPQ